MEKLEEYNRFITGDAVKSINTLEKESIDLILFSPPYDNLRDYKNQSVNFDFENLNSACNSVLKPGGFCVIIIQEQTTNHRKSATMFNMVHKWLSLPQYNWGLFECCIYKRHGNPGARWSKRFRVDHEYILMFFKGDRPRLLNKDHLKIPSKHAGKTFSGTDSLTDGSTKKIISKEVNPTKCRGTIWEYNTSNTEGNRLKLKHPATFPDKLAEDIILCFTNPGDIVIDPYCGSGTTCIMAKKNNRKFIGIDISPEYINIANQRLQEE